MSEERKKVLIITYYWPPSGGAGVQRWLQFSKYLYKLNWEPIIYTPSNPEAPSEDITLLQGFPEAIQIIKRKIWEPYTIYKKFTGKKSNQKINAGFISEGKEPGFLENLSVWIRGNLFIPDARKFWIQPSIRFLNKYLNDNTVDYIISTGPPHSMHLIALGLKNKIKAKWIADFRDPWTNIDFYDQLKLSKKSDLKHRVLERKVLLQADHIITVGNQMTKEFEEMGAEKISTITNGFDPKLLYVKAENKDTKFSITHIGSLNKDRNHPIFWEAISELCVELENFKTDLKIKFVGKTDVSVFNYIEMFKLSDLVEKIDYLDHNEIVKIQRSTQILYLPLNNTANAKGIITGKIFEYLAAKRPILAIGPEDGDLAQIIDETSSGQICNFTDKERLKEIITAYYLQYKSGTLECNSINIEKYSRENLTKSLIDLLNRI